MVLFGYILAIGSIVIGVVSLIICAILDENIKEKH